MKCLLLTLLGLLALESALAETPTNAPAFVSDGVLAFKTRVASGNASMLRLNNGAVVDIPEGIPGSIALQSVAVLFGDGVDCNIWIEGKKAYSCNWITKPVGNGLSARWVNISPVRDQGKNLTMLDGSRYQVDSVDLKKTALWLELSRGLMIGGNELINLDTGDAVGVQRVR